MHQTFSVVSAIIVIFGTTGRLLAGCPQFTAQTIDPHVGDVCYAVTTADVDGNGLLDIVAVSENRVQWYAAPTWDKHIILDGQTDRDNVCIAPADLDGDGQVDFALGAGWMKTNTGTIQWITRGANPEDRWTTHFIAQEKSTHRMSFGDILGNGRLQLIVSPLNRSIDGKLGARLLAFEIPALPKTDRWPLTEVDQTLNRMHNHVAVDFNGDGQLDLLTASEEGVSLIQRPANEFKRTVIATGETSEQSEQRGAGEIKVGSLRKGTNFLATIEPMHGHSVVVYTKATEQNWKRNVIDRSLKQGHAIWTADLDGDGQDEIVAGSRDRSTGEHSNPVLLVFSNNKPDDESWTRHVIDAGGVAVEDALVADFNQDGRPDILAGGRSTHNLKLYLNQGGQHSTGTGEAEPKSPAK